MKVAHDIAPFGRRQCRIGFSARFAQTCLQVAVAELRCQFLQHRTHLIGLAAFTFPNPPHSRAAIRFGFDKAGRLERAERFAHRGLAEVKLTRDLHLDQSRARRVGAVSDPIGQHLASAIAQINAVSETILRQAPQGTTPPQIISYNAANVPVAQLNLFSDTLSGQQLFDYGLNFARLQLFTIPGFSSPAPLGGLQRAVVVNLDPKALCADNLSPVDVGNALATANVVILSGTARMGNYEYNVDLNMSPTEVADFNRLPIRFVNGAPIFIGDVAPVSDTH